MITLMVEAVCRSLALGCVVWLALAVLRPRNPHLHKTVWTTVLAASCAMPLLLQWKFAPVLVAPQSMSTLTLGAASLLPHATNWAAVATVAYALVSVALLARLAGGLTGMWRIRRGAKRVERVLLPGITAEVRTSPKIRAPATFGATILLPAEFGEWSESGLTAVLLHEQAHVRQKDCYVQWLARLHSAVFWVNPLAWWLQRHLATLAETTSDDAVIRQLGDRPAYAGLLLDMARTQPASRVALAAAHSNVGARIERIISGIPPAPPLQRLHRALAIALLLPAVTASAASMRLSALAGAGEAPPKTVAAPIESGKAVGPHLPQYFVAATVPLTEFYPAEAMRKGIEGLVDIRVTLDKAGHATNTLVLSEQPLEMGFGAAASAAVHTFEFRNPTGQVTEFSMRVKFELAKEAAPAATPQA